MDLIFSLLKFKVNIMKENFLDLKVDFIYILSDGQFCPEFYLEHPYFRIKVMGLELCVIVLFLMRLYYVGG